MSKLTPAPWNWYQEGPHLFLRGCTLPSQDNCVLALRDDWATWQPFRDTANARLIAAAPDLLLACQMAYKILCAEGYNIGLGTGLFTRLRRAIDKAEGSSS